MEKNLFENAKFGDKFVTRDGRCALYIDSITFTDHIVGDYPGHELLEEDALCFIKCTDDGSYIDDDDRNDIVSRYQKSVNEDVLNKLAEENIPKFYDEDDEWIEPFTYGFKYGYKLAKEG